MKIEKLKFVHFRSEEYPLIGRFLRFDLPLHWVPESIVELMFIFCAMLNREIKAPGRHLRYKSERPGEKEMTIKLMQSLNLIQAAHIYLDQLQPDDFELAASELVHSGYNVGNSRELRNESALLGCMIKDLVEEPYPVSLEFEANLVRSNRDRCDLLCMYGVYQIDLGIAASIKDDWKQATINFANAGVCAFNAKEFQEKKIHKLKDVRSNAQYASGFRHKKTDQIKHWAVQNYEKYYRNNPRQTTEIMLADAIKYSNSIGHKAASEVSLFNMIYKHLLKIKKKID